MKKNTRIKLASNGNNFDLMVELFEESLKSIETTVDDLDEISDEINDIDLYKDHNKRLLEIMADDYKDAKDDLLSVMKDLKRTIYDRLESFESDTGIDSSYYKIR